MKAQAVAVPAAEPAEQVSTDIHGFKLERQQWVAEYNSTVLLYRHEKTGQLASSILVTPCSIPTPGRRPCVALHLARLQHADAKTAHSSWIYMYICRFL